MKMRFITTCARCRAPLTVGMQAVRMFGGVWHPKCAIEYKKGRAMRMTR